MPALTRAQRKKLTEEIIKAMHQEIARYLVQVRELDRQLRNMSELPHALENTIMRKLILLFCLLRHMPGRTKVQLLAKPFVLKKVCAQLQTWARADSLQLRQEYALIKTQAKAVLDARQQA